MLVTLGQEYVSAGALDGSGYLTLGAIIRKAAEISANATASSFRLGAMMLYVVLYQSKLVPRWLSVWGIIGVVLHLALTGLPGLANLVGSFSPNQIAANAPILVQEMVMAVWLIVKGFNAPAVAPEPAKTATHRASSAA